MKQAQAQRAYNLHEVEGDEDVGTSSGHTGADASISSGVPNKPSSPSSNTPRPPTTSSPSSRKVTAKEWLAMFHGNLDKWLESLKPTEDEVDAIQNEELLWNRGPAFLDPRSYQYMLHSLGFQWNEVFEDDEDGAMIKEGNSMNKNLVARPQLYHQEDSWSFYNRSYDSAAKENDRRLKMTKAESRTQSSGGVDGTSGTTSTSPPDHAIQMHSRDPLPSGRTLHVLQQTPSSAGGSLVPSTEDLQKTRRDEEEQEGTHANGEEDDDSNVPPNFLEHQRKFRMDDDYNCSGCFRDISPAEGYAVPWTLLMFASMMRIGYSRRRVGNIFYDWRKAPLQWEVDGTFEQARLMVELYRARFGKPVVLLSWSQGGRFVHSFLDWLERSVPMDEMLLICGQLGADVNGLEDKPDKLRQLYKDLHVKHWIAIATPFTGAPNALLGALMPHSGANYYLGQVIPWIRDLDLRNMTCSWPGAAYLLPQPGSLPQKSDVVMRDARQRVHCRFESVIVAQRRNQLERKEQSDQNLDDGQLALTDDSTASPSTSTLQSSSSSISRRAPDQDSSHSMPSPDETHEGVEMRELYECNDLPAIFLQAANRWQYLAEAAESRFKLRMRTLLEGAAKEMNFSSVLGSAGGGGGGTEGLVPPASSSLEQWQADISEMSIEEIADKHYSVMSFVREESDDEEENEDALAHDSIVLRDRNAEADAKSKTADKKADNDNRTEAVPVLLGTEIDEEDAEDTSASKNAKAATATIGSCTKGGVERISSASSMRDRSASPRSASGWRDNDELLPPRLEILDTDARDTGQHFLGFMGFGSTSSSSSSTSGDCSTKKYRNSCKQRSEKLRSKLSCPCRNRAQLEEARLRVHQAANTQYEHVQTLRDSMQATVFNIDGLALKDDPQHAEREQMLLHIKTRILTAAMPEVQEWAKANECMKLSQVVAYNARRLDETHAFRRLRPPNVNTTAFVGTKIQTGYQYRYDDGIENFPTKIFYTDGDGTVPTESAAAAKYWARESYTERIGFSYSNPQPAATSTRTTTGRSTGTEAPDATTSTTISTTTTGPRQEIKNHHPRTSRKKRAPSAAEYRKILNARDNAEAATQMGRLKMDKSVEMVIFEGMGHLDTLYSKMTADCITDILDTINGTKVA
ncbi:unnamed protein product [Amoebophrya sp. A25]|nr:unnamed protein product [Amoebophrya sp. A25]|eukprot:GSA25T00026667001.1